MRNNGGGRTKGTVSAQSVLTPKEQGSWTLSLQHVHSKCSYKAHACRTANFDGVDCHHMLLQALDEPHYLFTKHKKFEDPCSCFQNRKEQAYSWHKKAGLLLAKESKPTAGTRRRAYCWQKKASLKLAHEGGPISGKRKQAYCWFTETKPNERSAKTRRQRNNNNNNWVQKNKLSQR